MDDFYSNLESDSYTIVLKQWSLENFADEFIEDVVREYIDNATDAFIVDKQSRPTYWDILSRAQFRAKELIYEQVLEFINREDKQ